MPPHRVRLHCCSVRYWGAAECLACGTRCCWGCLADGLAHSQAKVRTCQQCDDQAKENGWPTAMSEAAYLEQEAARDKIIRIQFDEEAFPWKRFWPTVSVLDRQKMDPGGPGHAHPLAAEDVFCSAAILTDRLSDEMKCPKEGFLFTMWRDPSKQIFVCWGARPDGDGSAHWRAGGHRTKRVIGVHGHVGESWVWATAAEIEKCRARFRTAAR